jgi:hypothetical protein
MNKARCFQSTLNVILTFLLLFFCVDRMLCQWLFERRQVFRIKQQSQAVL